MNRKGIITRVSETTFYPETPDVQKNTMPARVPLSSPSSRRERR